jgi:hypothetical protein
MGFKLLNCPFPFHFSQTGRCHETLFFEIVESMLDVFFICFFLNSFY